MKFSLFKKRHMMIVYFSFFLTCILKNENWKGVNTKGYIFCRTGIPHSRFLTEEFWGMGTKFLRIESVLSLVFFFISFSR